MKKHVFIFLVLLMLLTAISAYFLIKEERNSISQIPDNSTFWPFSNSLKIALKRMMIANSIRPDEINRINFALPGHADFDATNGLSLFGEGNFALSDITLAMEEMSSEAVDPGFLVTTGNRVRGAAGSETEVISVLPTNSKSRCLKAERNIAGENAQIPVIDVPLNLSSPAVVAEPDEIVTLPKPIGCVRAKNGLFAYYTLLER